MTAKDIAPDCPYCKGLTTLVTGEQLYPRRPEFASKRFYRCAPCDAHVGVHEGTLTPLGTPANAELRAARQRAHQTFDGLWNRANKYQRRAYRSYCYRALAEELGMQEVHIGQADLALCARIIEVSARWLFAGGVRGNNTLLQESLT